MAARGSRRAKRGRVLAGCIVTGCGRGCGALDVSSASPCSVVSGVARSSISSSTAGRTVGRSSASRARPADDLLADGESGRERACASCIGQAQMTYGIHFLSTSIAIEAASYSFGTPFSGWPPPVTFGPIWLYRNLRTGPPKPAILELKRAVEKLYSDKYSVSSNS
jgi:hypothetical protein